MGFVETVTDVLTSDRTPETTEYVCEDCGNEFDSGKSPERIVCPDCLAQGAVSPAE